ncbi:MAG TPA: DUF4424 family protein [Rhizomicrobium sp.]|jgi:hypothetical protein|nr:DUF4424 family protein [Rhizomicrobium sp.]
MRLLIAALACALATPVLADDSTAELAAGGLQFTHAPDIRMAVEDLRISPTDVRIRYEFANDGAKDVTTIVAFPLPDIDSYEFYGSPIGMVQKDPVNFVGFKAVVDGKPVAVQVEQRAILNGRDVTAQVKAAGLPVNVILARDNNDLIAALPAAKKAALVKAGLAEMQDEDNYAARWIVRTKFYWTQTFPAGKTVVIEHSYKPVTGQALYSEYELNAKPTDDGGPKYRQDYCMDTGTMTAAARMLAARKKASPDNVLLNVTTTDFILTTANNWKGGIGKFHLTIDKQAPGNILSLCNYDDIKKTSAITFEVTRTNFAPTSDIKFMVLSMPTE